MLATLLLGLVLPHMTPDGQDHCQQSAPTRPTDFLNGIGRERTLKRSDPDLKLHGSEP